MAVKYTKAQMKIQQMAFMILAIVLFFSLVALIYFSISFSQLKEKAGNLAEDEARELALQMSSTPELAFTSGTDCAACLDFDKALALKQLNIAKDIWNLDYLQIEKVYPQPSNEDECTPANRLDCKYITLISSTEYSTKTAFVSLVRSEGAGVYRFELGRVHASAKKQVK